MRPTIAEYNGPLYHEVMNIHDSPSGSEDRVYQPDLARRMGIKQGTLRGYVARREIPPPTGKDGMGHPYWSATAAANIVAARARKRRGTTQPAPASEEAP